MGNRARRRIFDCFIFYNELDILEVRLNEMADVVDRFVIVEANSTFQGDPKPLYFAENRSRFKRFADKISYVECNFPPVVENRLSRRFDQNWGRENFQRDQIIRGLSDADRDDLIILSDVDEILNPVRLKEAIKVRRRHDLTIFTMPMYRFCFNRRLRETWKLGPRMTEFSRLTSMQNLRSARLSWSKRAERLGFGKLHARLRNAVTLGVNHRISEVGDAGWHFTSIGDWNNWKTKISAFAHAEWRNDPTFKDEAAYLRYMLETTDIAPLEELPNCIRNNLDKFGKFLA
jgi:beta-1,4-mannosyl-glycoprotein beta-1,4-N-acetylglucosaminyltransferase